MTIAAAATAANTHPATVSLVWAALVSGSAVAAVVGAVVSIWLARRKSREEQLARVRIMLAEAFQAVADYKEFPYAIRRRRHDHASDERVRLSDEMRAVQSRLTFYVEWTRIEDAAVGSAYAKLVRRLRAVAGQACNEAWSAAAITSDAEMNIAREQVDLAALAEFEREFADAASRYVGDFMKWHWWYRKN